MRPAFIAAAALACAGCSTVKVASLRDARVLPAGEQEFSLEASTTGPLQEAIGSRARASHPEVAKLSDTLGFTGPDRGTGESEPGHAGFSYARGLGNGWEAHGGLNLPVLRAGSYLGDVGVKKRLAEWPRTLLSAYGRAAAGYVVEDFTVYVADGALTDHDYRGEAQSTEADLALIGQFRKSENLSFYLSSGPTAGLIRWELLDRDGGTLRQGSAPLLGWKNHVGFAMEFRRYELMVEASLNVYDEGVTAGLGVRQSWKAGFKR